MQFSEFEYNTKHPIILPKCELSKLQLKFYYEFYVHAGVETMHSHARSNFLIIGVHNLAKSIVHECLACKRFDTTLCSQPVSPLPDLRVKAQPPFTVTGLDFAGPIYCRDNPNHKYYALVFSCAVVRAIHLELTDSMSLEDFMFALRKFTSQRGIPKVIFSDNAKTFRAASKDFHKNFKSVAPEWKFIVP